MLKGGVASTLLSDNFAAFIRFFRQFDQRELEEPYACQIKLVFELFGIKNVRIVEEREKKATDEAKRAVCVLEKLSRGELRITRKSGESVFLDEYVRIRVEQLRTILSNDRRYAVSEIGNAVAIQVLKEIGTRVRAQLAAEGSAPAPKPQLELFGDGREKAK